MYFHRHLLKPEGGAYEVILIMKPYLALEEFADEFGFTEKAEEDINRVAVGYVKKKFPNLKVKTIKVMMSGALVTSIMVTGGMTPVFANELDGEAQVETNNNPDIQPETATSDEPIETETSPTDEATTTNSIEEEPDEVPIVEELITDDTKSEEVPLDEPGLVPGDFFYFVEVIAEKVQLAMTFDDTAKAELISQFANERIAEANALFEAGDMEGAMELLNEALESQELALDYVTEGEGTEQSLSEEAEVIPEGEILSEHTEGKVDPTEDGDAEPTEPISEVYQELQTQFSQNITALLLAMEKVENPKAKAALAKNVEKAYAKMEKKLGKVREIEEQIASTIPDDNKVNELRNTIREDQKDFDRDMVEVEKKEGAPIVPPKSMKEKLQTSQGQETASQAKQNSQGKNTVPEKQVEKRTPTPEPKNETQASTNPAGERKNRNTNANRNDGGNSKVETEVELNKEVGEKVKSITKGNSDKGNPNKEKGNQGKGNGKDNE